MCEHFATGVAKARRYMLPAGCVKGGVGQLVENDMRRVVTSVCDAEISDLAGSIDVSSRDGVAYELCGRF